MAASFGVQLKKSGLGDDVKKPGTTPGGARRSDFKTKPVSDLKAMYNKKDEEAKSSEIVTKKVTSATSIDHGSNYNKYDSSANHLNSGSKLSSSPTTTRKANKDISGSGLTKEDIKAFALLKDQLANADLADLDTNEPVVAVAKTFGSGKAYTATVDSSKLQTAGDEPSKPATKTQAASFLTFGLTKLRTRPGSLKNDEAPAETFSVRGLKGGRSDVKSESPTNTKELKKDKYIPGVAKGWKGSGDELDSDSKVGRFQESSVGKVRTEIKTEKEVKVKGFRSVSPININRQSSEDSSSSSVNLSPRGYKPNIEFTVKNEKEDEKTDINKNIKKTDIAKTDTTVFKSKLDNQNQFKSDIHKNRKLTETKSNTNKVLSPKLSDAKDRNAKPKLSAVEQLANDKERIKANRHSGSFSSDSEKGKRSPKAKSDFKWLDKSRISLEEFKEQRKLITDAHRPLSRTSSSGSSSSLNKSDASDIRSRIERFASPEPKDAAMTKLDRSPAHSPLGKTDLRRQDYGTSKKINPDRFKDIKKGFERGNVEKGSTAYQDHKPLHIKTEKKLLERKQSFEGGVVFRKKSYDRKEVISPRDRGNVLQTVKALAELDAKAKAQPVIMRRTQSLPSESLDEDDSSVYEEPGQYYDEIQGMRMGDDVSNEGDISSEADLIYEEIPAYMGDGKF